MAYILRCLSGAVMFFHRSENYGALAWHSTPLCVIFVKSERIAMAATTRLTRPDGRTFRLHVPVKEPERSESKSARGVDVGAVHMAATADTGGRTHVFGLPDGARRRNGDGIDGLRGKAGRQKGRSRGWRETMRRVHAKGRKIRNRQINAERHAAREIADGVGTVVIEDLHPKPMTAKGGRRKKAMNRGMRYGRIGALLARIRLTAENASVRAVKADPRGTSITCVECGHADRDSWRSRSVFICVRCGHGADADINAARNLPARRQDMSSKGPSAPSRSTPGLSGNGRIGETRETREKCARARRRGACRRARKSVAAHAAWRQAPAACQSPIKRTLAEIKTFLFARILTVPFKENTLGET